MQKVKYADSLCAKVFFHVSVSNYTPQLNRTRSRCAHDGIMINNSIFSFFWQNKDTTHFEAVKCEQVDDITQPQINYPATVLPVLQGVTFCCIQSICTLTSFATELLLMVCLIVVFLPNYESKNRLMQQRQS